MLYCWSVLVFGLLLSSRAIGAQGLRPIQVQSTNARGQQDVATTRYDFAGKVLSRYTTHEGPNHAPVAVREQSRYDHAGRVLETTQSLDGQAPTPLARFRYNELGQVQKKLGPGAEGLQAVDYRYHIRGWLTDVNDVQAPDARDLWHLHLSYDCGFETPQYNGNLAGQTWRSASDGIERAYGYRYDALSRLLQGDYVARTGPSPTAPWGAEGSNYRFWAASYDAAGNLLTLRRRGPGLKSLNQYTWNSKEQQEWLNRHNHGWRFYAPRGWGGGSWWTPVRTTVIQPVKTCGLPFELKQLVAAAQLGQRKSPNVYSWQPLPKTGLLPA